MPTLAVNRQVNHDYEILEKFTAGLVLTGPEVKSARGGNVNFKGSYIAFSREGFPELVSTHIAPYPPAAREQKDYNPTKTRKLLLNKKEINYLRGKTDRTGLTIVPLHLYTHGQRIKLEVGLAKGIKKYDKREKMKEKDINRRLRRGEEI